MRKKQLVIFLIFFVTLASSITGNAVAAPATSGLYITPARQYLSVDAGKESKSTLTVADHTDSPLNVAISVEQFSVTPYTYDYTFQAPIGSWLHLGQTDLTLTPGQTMNVPYVITPPPSSPPGGHYYTLIASATVESGGASSTIQAADLLYITINGNLTTTSHLQSSHIQRLIFGRTIPFTLDPINTGNTYSYVYVSGLLHGYFVKPPETSTAHLLIPGKVRALTGDISSPLLPGVYQATYGYKTTAGDVVQKSAWIVFIPPWSVAFVLALLLIAGKFLPRRHHKVKEPPTKSD